METPIKHYLYYRVSTKYQKASGLGLLAQQTISQHYSKIEGAEIVKEVTEIESGKSIENRPVLMQAIKECNENGYILCVSKLDRLSRSVKDTFNILELLDGKLKAFDLPGKLDIVIIALFSSLSQREAEILSLRTKAALSELKKRGVKLGNPENLTLEHRKKGAESTRRKAEAFRSDRRLTSVVYSCMKENMTAQQMADELNKLGFTTSMGKMYNKTSAGKLIRDSF